MDPTSAGTDSRRDTTLDVLRVVAALGVVATHARWLAHPTSGRTATFWDALHATLWQGSRTSVYIFFALSGFLIARPYITALLDGAPLPGPRDYARRRVARIVPAYWLALAAFLLFGFGAGAHAGNVIDHFLLVHNEVPGDAGSLLPVAWTLGIEATFYLAVPCVASLARRAVPGPVPRARVLAWVWGATVASAALNVAVYTRRLPTGWHTVVQYTLPAQLLFFMPGILLAIGEHRRPRPVLLPGELAAGIGVAVAGWVGCMYLFVVVTSTPAGLSSIGFALLSGLILCLARWTTEPRSLLGRATVWVGSVSYGLYLWHWIVMRAMYGWWGAAFAGTHAISWLLATVVVFTATLPVAAVSWYLVERPLMRRARRGSPAPAVSPPAELAVGLSLETAP